ncbi:MAG: hypothetical protein K9L62_06340 [Vallitaleaceae bacterium]|nr:hypothetical protein [Vallitaleaceae bacterium]
MNEEKGRYCERHDENIKTLNYKVEKIEKKIEGIPVISKLLEQQIESNNKQTDAISRINGTLIKIDLNMERMSDSQNEMKKDLDELKTDVKKDTDTIGDNIKDLQDVQNINWVNFVKENWWKIIILLYAAFEVVNKLEASGVLLD